MGGSPGVVFYCGESHAAALKHMDRQQAGWVFDTPGPDDWGCGWAATDVKNIGQVVEHPLKKWPDLDRYRPPDPRNPFYYECGS